MTIFEKIRKIFKAEENGKSLEKIHPNETNIADLDAFLHEKQNFIETKFKQKIEILYSELQPILDNLKEHTEQLVNLDISKYKAEARIIKMTELGRKDYIYKIYKLINNLNQKEIYQPNYIKSKIEEFAMESAKSDFKATLLIGKEIEKIRNDIIKINSLEKDFMNENEKLIKNKDNLIDLLQKNAEIKNNEKVKIEINKEIDEIKKLQKDNEKKLSEIEMAIQKIKLGSDFKEKQAIEKELKQKYDLLKEAELKIKNLIDRKILEKYSFLIILF